MTGTGLANQWIFSGSFRAGLLALGLLAAGCVTTPVGRVENGSEQASAEYVSAEQSEPDSATGPAFTGAQSSATDAPTRPIPAGAPLAIVLNDPGLRQLEMLRVFSARLGRPYEIYNIAHRDPARVVQSLKALAPIEVIALGPAAFDLTRTVAGLDVFYAGVLDPGLTTQGVDALPPFPVQLDYWREQNVSLKRLGVIGGVGMTDRLAALAKAAAERNITVEQRTVSSGTEVMLAFRALVPHIDGFVFLPDETVLSPRVIQQVMKHGRRNHVQILVYSPVMFNLGASLFLQPDPVGVADALVQMVQNPELRPEVTRMRSRSRLAEKLELTAVDVADRDNGD